MVFLGSGSSLYTENKTINFYTSLTNLLAQGEVPFMEAPDEQNVHWLILCFQFNGMTKEKVLLSSK